MMQPVAYNDKCKKAIQFQTVTASDGLITHFCAPLKGNVVKRLYGVLMNWECTH